MGLCETMFAVHTAEPRRDAQLAFCRDPHLDLLQPTNRFAATCYDRLIRSWRQERCQSRNMHGLYPSLLWIAGPMEERPMRAAAAVLNHLIYTRGCQDCSPLRNCSQLYVLWEEASRLAISIRTPTRPITPGHATQQKVAQG